MIDQIIYNRVAKLENYAPTMLKEFACLTQAKEAVRRWNAVQFQTLEVTQINPYTIDATYLNTTVRFQLYLGHKDNNPKGRVICFNVYTVCDEPHYDTLGEFSFDLSGRTDLSVNEHGEIRTIDGSADEIVIGFLNKAIEQGPQLLAQAKN